VEDILADYIEEEHLKEIFCATLSNCEMYELKPKNGKQDKICCFNNCTVTIGTEPIEQGDGRT